MYMIKVAVGGKVCQNKSYFFAYFLPVLFLAPEITLRSAVRILGITGEEIANVANVDRNISLFASGDLKKVRFFSAMA
jgi:hypothetical protein